MKKCFVKAVYFCLSFLALFMGLYAYKSVHRSGKSDENKIELLLKLPEGDPEKLVVLKGKLILKLFPGPPEYTSIDEGDRADYCWMLLMDATSFAIATTTLVPEPSSDLKSIMNWSNHDEVYLSLEDNMIDFCCNHASEDVVVQGYLFHAHTAHHYSPILMNVKKIFIES